MMRPPALGLELGRFQIAYGAPTATAHASETVRSKGDDDEDHNANSALCRASAGFALCHRPLQQPVAERFHAYSESGRLPLGVGGYKAETDVSDELPIG